MNCNLSIIAGSKEDKSYLKDLYLTLPFRAVPVGQRKNDNRLYLMIMSSSPGILSGDMYNFDIKVEDKSYLQLQSQSYQRLFNMDKDKEATQNINIEIGNDAFFSYVPHPVVPHENSIFKSKTQINIGENSSVIISEIITCGRKHSGEVFKFEHFQNLMEIRHKNKLVLKDNVILQPKNIPMSSMGILEEYTHQGTFAFFSTKDSNEVEELVDSIFNDFQDNNSQIEMGISVMGKNGFMIRALGQGGESMYNFFLKIQDELWANN